MPFTNNGSVRLHWGEEGTGTPLLLVMGHLFSSDMWYPVLPELAKKHRVIWFDNRGSGLSDATKDATVADLAADARAVLDAAGVGSAHVFGVSMGGGVAMQLGYDSPERVTSLILGCTALRSETHTPRKRGSSLAYYIPIRFLRKSFSGMYGPACPPEAAARDLDVLMKMKYSPKGILGQSRAMSTYDLTADKVATLTMPALVLHGDVDEAVKYQEGEKLHAILPNNTFITYQDAGHNFIVTYKDKVVSDVLEFLGEVDAKNPTVVKA
jgi:pimeloyl-ACP methyl ester carboxylesterase